ncbi:MAG: TlpA disulfide reductase family protein [Nitrospinota bacterium]|nr:TlpA disulfide reductase family protein [Nitrospinota bacterium]
MKEKIGKIALVVFLTPFLLTILWGLISHLNKSNFKGEQKKIVLQRGVKVPDFSFPGLDGSTIKLSDYKGKVVLLNIWASWCIPCLDEMPSLQNLYQKMKESQREFEIIAVSIDALGAEVVNKFVTKYKITFPVALDPRHKIKKMYSAKGVPETFVIDTKGILISKIIGPKKWDDLKTIEFFKGIAR